MLHKYNDERNKNRNRMTMGRKDDDDGNDDDGNIRTIYEMSKSASAESL